MRSQQDLEGEVRLQMKRSTTILHSLPHHVVAEGLEGQELRGLIEVQVNSGLLVACHLLSLICRVIILMKGILHSLCSSKETPVAMDVSTLQV